MSVLFLLINKEFLHLISSSFSFFVHIFLQRPMPSTLGRVLCQFDPSYSDSCARHSSANFAKLLFWAALFFANCDNYLITSLSELVPWKLLQILQNVPTSHGYWLRWLVEDVWVVGVTWVLYPDSGFLKALNWEEAWGKGWIEDIEVNENTKKDINCRSEHNNWNILEGERSLQNILIENSTLLVSIYLLNIG